MGEKPTRSRHCKRSPQTPRVRTPAPAPCPFALVVVRLKPDATTSAGAMDAEEDVTTASHFTSSRPGAGDEAARSGVLERRQGQLPCAAPQPIVVRRGRDDHDVRRGRRTKSIARTQAGRSSRRRRSGWACTLCPGLGSWATYEDGYRRALADARALGITPRDLRRHHVRVESRVPRARVRGRRTDCRRAALGRADRSRCIANSSQTGADARIVTVRDGVLDPSWLGRRLTLDLLTDITSAERRSLWRARRVPHRRR